MSVNMGRQRMAGVKIVLLIIVGLSLCMPICELADHHGSGVSHPLLCTIDIPRVFQLLILMNSLFLAVLAKFAVPPAPTFSLLKPPRLVVL